MPSLVSTELDASKKNNCQGLEAVIPGLGAVLRFQRRGRRKKEKYQCERV